MRLGSGLAVVVVAGSLLAAPPALADDPPLATGETIRDRGFAAMVVDGDTLRFSHSRNRLTDNYQVIRLLGVQAPGETARCLGLRGPGGP